MTSTALAVVQQYDLTVGGVLDAGERMDFLDSFQTMDVKEVDQQIVRGSQVREASTHILCTAIAEMQNRWHAGDVPLTMMGEYELDFYIYVRARTGTDYSRSAIDNFGAVGRAWFTDDIPKGIPATVQLYDAEGQRVVDKEGELRTVPFNPCLLNTSKLIHGKAALASGQLAANPVALGQLFNPKVGFRTALASLNSRGDTTQSTEHVPVQSTGMRMYIQGPYLMADEEGEDAAIVAEIDWESVKAHPVARRALQFLVAVLQVDGL